METQDLDRILEIVGMESEYSFEGFDNSGYWGRIGLDLPWTRCGLDIAARGITPVPGD